MKSVLITGIAGFIGFHTARECLRRGMKVVGIDNINSYYDVKFKHGRLKLLEGNPGLTFEKMDLQDRPKIDSLFRNNQFDCVIHLAAQAGVRYSLEDPFAYIDSNMTGTLSILEGCRHTRVPHLVYASSSSVYGTNTTQPFSVRHPVDHPISLYAATKKSNELMAHCYSHLFEIPTTGLRFFTVYGPWGRPDMALYKFTKAIYESRPIDVYNNGEMKRDFTYVADIVDAILRVIDHIPVKNPNWDSSSPDPGSSSAPFRIFNIGNNQPTTLMRFIEIIEKTIGIEAVKNFLPMQPGDVSSTYADIDDLTAEVGFRPATSLEVGIKNFIDWYREFHGIR